MEPVLNITNGDSAVTIIKESGIPGTILPWRDVLHDGPVPAGLSLEELSGVRVQFLAGQGWGETDAISRSFTERDKRTFQNEMKELLCPTVCVPQDMNDVSKGTLKTER